LVPNKERVLLSYTCETLDEIMSREWYAILASRFCFWSCKFETWTRQIYVLQ